MSKPIFWSSKKRFRGVGLGMLGSSLLIGSLISSAHAAPLAQDKKTVGDTQIYQAYMQGYPDNLFRPEQSVMRSEIAAILHRLIVSPIPSNSIKFTDVPSTYWANDEIALAVSNGWMDGTGGNTFSPNRQVTRGEMAQILMNVYGWGSGSASSFRDTKQHWAKSAIDAAVAQGVMAGYSDGSFRPDQLISRVETAKMFNRLTGRPADPQLPMTWSDVPSSAPDYGDIMAASIDHPV
ncbi:S-layer homology domain-containing protein [Saccharibacillus sp. JS10]|uniref:S-layer homology domain-containing protein n=1 Tax=Saccharibacillus sp. JS10 TaxID=2950552 RepID=UPI00210C87E1|nr:S-layer homology domain-containing protein [Saccharibacillus sp. JS10]MCQ4086501.1 S-layer homology domain-containing protein [Saccharibacillus sp. JS10]